jgi:predicted nucleic acid-binding protein
MKVFLDANVLVTVLNRQYPLFPTAARILSLADKDAYRMYTSPMCLAIAFYFAEKKTGTVQAKKKITMLSQKLRIAPNLETGVLHTIENSKINDFEDGLEYYAAIDAGCEVIVTEDTKDFWFSEIEVLDCEAFIKKIINSPL